MNNIGISPSKLKGVAERLNVLLASYSIFYQNLRSFHWHIQGDNFFEIHQLFEDLYNSAKTDIDLVAERILTINHKPLGSLSEYLQYSEIDEARDKLTDELMVSIVLHNLSILIRSVRFSIKEASKVEDEGTVDILSSMLAKMEKQSWKMTAWLNRLKLRTAHLTTINN